ncbi:outer membrane-stress sensor serine endopeptidase DegS [Conservatibacter flavescens]|uniref:Serine endoprotease DegS n=1 Tax=Conservatibacter flavescens TaxID=28161 RepID=A0A2M8S5S6_9PAST|nr:outer membrane-stress sensor serine endopeptidase DegS [Conservatibacter flavescens]PJG86496.1 outer membrane-stress sensor serine endopeptidase DegS [Conservatibacter flavescens]
MLKKLLQAAGIGLVAAVLILLILPTIQQNKHTDSEPMSFKNAVRLASPAVVNVYNQSFTNHSLTQTDLQVNNLGSGVIMSQDGYILTNKHVIENADQIVVALQSGLISNATLVGSDSLTDLAVLKINAESLPTITYNPKRQVHVGDVVLAIGNPYNLGQSVSQGIISATGRNAVGDAVGRQNFIQTDASINRGNSGGALINSLGELIGISTLSIGKDSNEIAEGLSFAIPIDLAIDVMNKIIRDGRVIRGYFGVQSNIYYSAGQAEMQSKGIVVTKVAPNGPAAKAGIREGDIIIKFGDTEATSPQQMMQVIADTPPNTSVKVLVSRLNKILTFTVVLAEYPTN